MDDKKKKILFVITKSNWGGAQRYVYDLATVLRDKGYNTKVATGGHGVLVEKLNEANVETIEIPGLQRDISLSGEFQAFVFLWKLFRKEKPDVVHLNSSKAGLGALAARLAGVKKIVFTLHGLAHNEERPAWQKFLIRRFYFLTILFSHKTIAVSKALQTQANSNFYLLSRKIVLVHNGLLIPEFMSRKDASLMLLKSAGIENVEIETVSMVFGTIGELHPIKGHEYLVEGFKDALDKSVIPLYLFIISDGQEREKRQKQIDSLNLQKHVFLCGRVDNAMRALKAFDIFIFPSLSEGLPYAVQEAGLASLPVIATNVGGIPELVVDRDTGLLIRPRSAKDITESMLELTYDPVLRKKLGSSLHKKISEDFNVDHMTLATEAIYNS